MPPSQTTPQAHQTTVAGLPVVDFTPDPSQCQRDVWLQETVLSVRADDLGATLTGPLRGQPLCRALTKLAVTALSRLGLR